MNTKKSQSKSQKNNSRSIAMDRLIAMLDPIQLVDCPSCGESLASDSMAGYRCVYCQRLADPNTRN